PASARDWYRSAGCARALAPGARGWATGAAARDPAGRPGRSRRAISGSPSVRSIIPLSASLCKSRFVPISVFAVEDSAPTLKALRKLLSGSEQLRLVGTASSGEEALKLAPPLKPQVVLMDLELPGASGIETTRSLKQLSDADVLVLTSFEDEQHVFDAMRAGASGYVVKGTPAGKLIEAIVEVEAGGTVIEPRLARRFWSFFKGVQEPRKP